MKLRRLLGVLCVLAVGCGDDSVATPDAPPSIDAPSIDAAPPDAAPSGIGMPCTAPNPLEQGTCAAGQVCATDAQGFPGGFCTAHCDTTACPSDSICVAFGSNRFCGLACTRDSDCRQPDYTCQPGPAPSQNTMVCFPASMNGMPPPGTNNGQACTMPIVNPPGTGSLFAPDVQVSGNGFAAEVELAVHPTTHHIVVAYIDISTQPNHIGVVRSIDDGATFSTPILLPLDTTVDANQLQSDPIVAVDPSGNFYIIWVGFDLDQTGNPTNMRMWVARSTDSGATWQLFPVSPAGEWDSTSLLDKPWIAASPVDGSLSATWLRGAGSTLDIRYTRSTDMGATWSTPITISDTSARPGLPRNLTQIVYGANGKSYATWVELPGAQFGSTSNQVYLQRMNADGTRDGANVLVTGGTDSPAFDDPSIAVAGSNVYVGFISGVPTGQWDVRVAASLDGGMTFGSSVKVNDEATCATHFHHQLAVDGAGRVHAIWYDNRYLFGSLFHASSPAAATGTPLQFGVNTYVNDASFYFTTRRDVMSWLGDYVGFAAVGNSLYAVWSDPRGGNTSRIRFAKGTAQ